MCGERKEDAAGPPVLALGVGLVIGGVVYESGRNLSDVGVQPTLLAMGILVTVAGAAGMALSCNKLAARKGQLRTLQSACRETTPSAMGPCTIATGVLRAGVHAVLS